MIHRSKADFKKKLKSFFVVTSECIFEKLFRDWASNEHVSSERFDVRIDSYRNHEKKFELNVDCCKILSETKVKYFPCTTTNK